MTIGTEARLVDIPGWLWLAAVILTLVFSGPISFVVVAGLGIAAAAGYFRYKYRRHPELFQRGRTLGFPDI